MINGLVGLTNKSESCTIYTHQYWAPGTGGYIKTKKI
jgi:hypothetical protein